MLNAKRLPEFILYAGQLEHVTETVSIMQCNGMTADQIFRYLERKFQIGRFSR